VGFETSRGSAIPKGPARLDKVGAARPPSEVAGKCATFRTADDSKNDISGVDSGDLHRRSRALRAEVIAALTKAIAEALELADGGLARATYEALGRALAVTD